MSMKIAAVGEKDAILVFKALGMDVFFATEADKIKKTILDLEEQGYSIIFITENEAIKVEAFLRTFDSKPYPVILSVPDGRSGTQEEGGFAIQKIIKNMERAVGSSAALR